MHLNSFSSGGPWQDERRQGERSAPCHGHYYFILARRAGCFFFLDSVNESNNLFSAATLRGFRCVKTMASSTNNAKQCPQSLRVWSCIIILGSVALCSKAWHRQRTTEREKNVANFFYYITPSIYCQTSLRKDGLTEF